VSDPVVWRVEALAAPPLVAPCARCDGVARFDCTHRFRVNAQQHRLDVWLLYRCAGCGDTRKRRLLHRRAVASLAPGLLDGYHRNDPALAWRHAFELRPDAPLPYRVERPPLSAEKPLVARIEQPWDCALRWDRFLATELGWPRARVERAFRRGELRLPGVRSLARTVLHGQLLEATGP